MNHSIASTIINARDYCKARVKELSAIQPYSNERDTEILGFFVAFDYFSALVTELPTTAKLDGLYTLSNAARHVASQMPEYGSGIAKAEDMAALETLNILARELGREIRTEAR